MSERSNKKEPGYFTKLPPVTRYTGDASRGEIEIIERASGDHAEGEPGIQFESKEYFLVRDAVRFPSGAESTPIRLIAKSNEGGPSGAVVLAHRDGQLFFRRIFRHGTRRWEIETPRGRREEGCTAAQAAENELKEELGFEAESLAEIGMTAPDTALMPSRLPVFWAELKPGNPEAEPEAGEAMGPIVGLGPAEIAERIQRGEIACGITIAALMIAVVGGKIAIPPAGS